MQFKVSSLFPAALLLATSTPVLSGTDGFQAPPSVKARSHRNIARSFGKRESGVPGTYYDVTMGEVACGGFYQPHDFTVAMNSRDFAGGSACGKKITINYQGKSESATVVDECPTCGGGGIDMTQGLFTVFAPTSVGELYLSWNWGGSAPAPTHKAPPPPPPKPTTTHHDTPTTTHTSTHHSTHSSSSSHSSSTSSSAAAAPTVPAGANNIASLYDVLIQLGLIVGAGASN